MKFKFKTQGYQTEAVSNICNVFKNQPYIDMIRYTRDLGIVKQQAQATIFDAFEKDDAGFENAKIQLDDQDLFENIKDIQKDNNYIVSDSLVRGLGACSLDIEMETGTGKTYVYIKSIFELNQRFGWSKFIIVVPSIAIREGVKKSFQMMEDHFMEQYNKKARYFVYNSKRLSELESFASSSDIQVMIINVQAFNARGADARRIDMVLDEFQSRRPIDVVAKTRPILIIDEPQKMGGDATQQSLKKFNPLFNMNFSATHEKKHNLIYCLDALDAYNKNLVKKIQVKGFEIKNLRGTDGYMYLQDIVISKDKPPMARLEFEVDYKTSGIKRDTKTIGVGYNLHPHSNELQQYENGYTINDINAYNGTITFLNGITLHIGEVVGDISDKDIRRIQIRETIKSHFEKEEFLFNKGIKCLSLFFIDEVVKYRDYSQDDEKGEYARMFEQEYTGILNDYIKLYETPYIKYLKKISAQDTHKGYFSVDKKTGKVIDSKETKGEGSDDISAYDLILKNKERLLSFEEPTRFIFSHSALREGWDNPNIFQICALKPGGESATAKRQEVGRGLRIAVNRVGDRVDYSYCHSEKSTFHNINKLTVIATDSYKDFVSDIQKEIKKNLAYRPTKANVEYFVGKYVFNGNESIQVTLDMAGDITSYLKLNNYIDKEGKITQEYRNDLENNALKEIPENFGLSQYTESIHKLVQSIFDENILGDIYENASKTKILDNPVNDNFKKKEFKTLWEEINHKYTYTVSFNSDELINKAVAEIDKSLYVTELKYTVTTGEQKRDIKEDEIKSGDSFGSVKTKTIVLKGSKSDNTKYDLIGKIAKNTTLTRKSVVKILQGIRPDVFAMFKANPEEFITKVSRIINEQKATMIVDHITYNIAEGKYDNDIFTANQIKMDYDKTYKASKAIQDFVVPDSEKERQFAEDLDGADEVCVYAKLPKTFQIPTPVGNYAPDWAIAFNDKCGIKHIYFIAETKGMMESTQFRVIEKAKIDCARKLFNESLQGKVRYDVVDNYSKLLDILRGK